MDIVLFFLTYFNITSRVKETEHIWFLHETEHIWFLNVFWFQKHFHLRWQIYRPLHLPNYFLCRKFWLLSDSAIMLDFKRITVKPGFYMIAEDRGSQIAIVCDLMKTRLYGDSFQNQRWLPHQIFRLIVSYGKQRSAIEM